MGFSCAQQTDAACSMFHYRCGQMWGGEVCGRLLVPQNLCCLARLPALTVLSMAKHNPTEGLAQKERPLKTLVLHKTCSASSTTAKNIKLQNIPSLGNPAVA